MELSFPRTRTSASTSDKQSHKMNPALSLLCVNIPAVNEIRNHYHYGVSRRHVYLEAVELCVDVGERRSVRKVISHEIGYCLPGENGRNAYGNTTKSRIIVLDDILRF